MVANNGALGPQPDFDIMADHLSEIAEHIRRCSNIPTVQGNKVILQAITEMRSELRRDIAELRTELRRDINELRTEVRQGFARQEALSVTPLLCSPQTCSLTAGNP